MPSESSLLPSPALPVAFSTLLGHPRPQGRTGLQLPVVCNLREENTTKADSNHAGEGQTRPRLRSQCGVSERREDTQGRF